jgi:hypothetical protein
VLTARVTERKRLRSFRSTFIDAALDTHERAEARVWKATRPARAALHERIARGESLGGALAAIMPAVARLAGPDVVLARRRLHCACRTIQLHARGRTRSRSRTTRRRRCAASRARSDGDGGDGEPPRQRHSPTATGGVS